MLEELNLALSHWPLVASVLFLYGVGQLTKAVVPTTAATFWKLLPLFPLVGGMLLGGIAIYSHVLDEQVPSKLGRFLYFSASGVCAAYLRDVIRTYAKYKGIEISQSSPPGAV